MDYVGNILSYIVNQALSMNIFDVIDIAIVSVLFYYVFKFVRDRRAGKLAVGILFVLIIMLLSNLLNMQALNFITENIVQVGIIGLIIVFQSELRSFLEKMGGESLRTFNRRMDHKNYQHTVRCIDIVVEGAVDFSAEKTGALIVFERGTKLGDVIKTGTVINSDPSVFLLKNIFFNKSPLHDGALIVRNNRFFSAGCFLPLSLNNDIIKDLGTRHRAAIGMSENSDSAIVVVSEETGYISIAYDGYLKRNLDEVSLKNELLSLLIGENVTVDTVEKKSAEVESAEYDSNDFDTEK
jgi:conserved hypothetical protein TIGR00159